MKVRMIAAISGTRDGSDWPAAGETLECSNGEGADLIAAGLATAITKAPAEAPETATAKKPETATVKGGLTKGSTGI